MAKIGAAHGVHGWVRMHSFADPVDALTGYQHFHASDRSGLMTVRQYSRTSKQLIAQIEGCDSREAAQGLTGTELSLCVSRLPKPGPDEYYWHELIGMTVKGAGDRELGAVSHLLDNGVQDLLVVRSGQDECLIPWAREHLNIRVDRPNQCISLDWDPEF